MITDEQDCRATPLHLAITCNGKNENVRFFQVWLNVTVLLKSYT